MASDSKSVVGSAGSAGSAGTIGSAGTVAGAGVVGSAGTVTSAGVVGSADQQRDAFNGHGWKLPATLTAGSTATLTVPRRLRGRVGLGFTQATQARVWRRGVRAADRRATFEACSADDAPARTAWPGGIVVDRRRCATLRVAVEGRAASIEQRVSLGKRCR